MRRTVEGMELDENYSHIDYYSRWTIAMANLCIEAGVFSEVTKRWTRVLQLLDQCFRVNLLLYTHNHDGFQRKIDTRVVVVLQLLNQCWRQSLLNNHAALSTGCCYKCIHARCV